jgi:methionine-rich copper-binding protein CopC
MTCKPAATLLASRVARTALLAGGIAAGAAFAAAPFHLRLTKSAPAANATVTAPTAIHLWFSQPPEVAVTSVRLTGPNESAVALGALTRADSAGAPIIAAVKGTVAPGAYTVRWRTMARDGHVVSGSFGFKVGGSGMGR